MRKRNRTKETRVRNVPGKTVDPDRRGSKNCRLQPKEAAVSKWPDVSSAVILGESIPHRNDARPAAMLMLMLPTSYAADSSSLLPCGWCPSMVSGVRNGTDALGLSSMGR